MRWIVLQLVDAFPMFVSESRPQAASQSLAEAKTLCHLPAKTQALDLFKFFHM
jgi:hypothetical protein